MKGWRRPWVVAVLACALTLAGPPARVAADYDCSDPDVQRALQYAWQVYGQLMDLYRSADAQTRAAMDREMRRTTGYSIPELTAIFNQCRTTRPTTRPTVRPTIRPTLTPAPSPSGGPLAFAPPARLPDAIAGQRYSMSLAGLARGGAPPYHFRLGTMGGFPPIGLLLSPSGTLSGTAARATVGRTYAFQVCAVDLGGTAVCRQVSLAVVAEVTPSPRVLAPGQYSFAPRPARTLAPAHYLMPPTARPEPAVARARSGPVAAASLPPVPADGVPVGSGRLKLGWELFGRTDLGDREAADLYRAGAEARIAALESDRRVAEAERAELARRGALFEEAVDDQRIESVVESLREDHAYFTDVRRDQLMAAGLALTGVGPLGTTGDVVGGISFGHDTAELVATLGRKAATGERWTLDDTQAAANVLAGGVGVASTIARSGVGAGISGGQAAISLAQAAYADYALRQIDLQILQPVESIEAHRRMLASRERAAASVVSGIAEEIDWRTRERDAVLRYVSP